MSGDGGAHDAGAKHGNFFNLFYGHQNTSFLLSVFLTLLDSEKTTVIFLLPAGHLRGARLPKVDIISGITHQATVPLVSGKELWGGTYAQVATSKPSFDLLQSPPRFHSDLKSS